MTDLPQLTVLPVANPAAEIVAVTDAPNQISLTMRVANLIAVILPFAGLLAPLWLSGAGAFTGPTWGFC